MSPNRIKTGCFYSIFTNYRHLKRYLNAGKPISKPNLNRLFIGCFEKTRLSSMVKNKKVNQIYFQTDFKYCFRGIFKKLIPAVTDLTNKMQ